VTEPAPAQVAVLGVVAVTVAAVLFAAGAFSAKSKVASAAVKKQAERGSTVRTESDVAGLIGDASFMAQSGLTQADFAKTRGVYTFGKVGADYASGATVYLTPVGKSGYCLTFVTAAACTHVQPDRASPVRGLGVDPDQQAAGQPFVEVGLAAADVKALSYRCGGTSYPATMSGRVVAFVAPSASLTPHDCQQVATLASGEVVTTQL
jgi:hypothetical protein